MELVFDIETDDLDATKIWCIVAIDENDKVYSYSEDKIEKGVKLLQKADKIIGITGDRQANDIRIIRSLASRDETDFEMALKYRYHSFQFSPMEIE